jgi:threonyl-tRNA synthetase
MYLFICGEMGRAFRTYGDKKIAYRVLVGKSEVKEPLARRRRRWEYNIVT